MIRFERSKLALLQRKFIKNSKSIQGAQENPPKKEKTQCQFNEPGINNNNSNNKKNTNTKRPKIQNLKETNGEISRKKKLKDKLKN